MQTLPDSKIQFTYVTLNESIFGHFCPPYRRQAKERFRELKYSKEDIRNFTKRSHMSDINGEGSPHHLTFSCKDSREKSLLQYRILQALPTFVYFSKVSLVACRPLGSSIWELKDFLAFARSNIFRRAFVTWKAVDWRTFLTKNRRIFINKQNCFLKMDGNGCNRNNSQPIPSL